MWVKLNYLLEHNVRNSALWGSYQSRKQEENLNDHSLELRKRQEGKHNSIVKDMEGQTSFEGSRHFIVSNYFIWQWHPILSLRMLEIKSETFHHRRTKMINSWPWDFHLSKSSKHMLPQSIRTSPLAQNI